MAIGKVVISANTSWNLVNFRASLIRALVGAGYEVVVVAPHDEYVSKLKELGWKVIDVWECTLKAENLENTFNKLERLIAV